MRNDQHLAINLRKKGASYNFIRKELGIPKSTLHYWFRDLQWSQVIKNELTKKAQRQATKRLRAVIQAQKKRWENQRKQYRGDARKEFSILKLNPLFLAGLMLYWGEGDSKIKNCVVKLANTDPEMIKIFSLFLQRICQVSKEEIKISLILYPDLNDEKCKIFWSKTSNIPIKQFVKTQFIEGRHPTKRLSYGICMIYHSSRKLKEKIFTWLRLYQNELKSSARVVQW